MNGSSERRMHQAGAWGFLATAWPVSLPTDSESQRRRKLAVRSGHLAMGIMVGTAVCGAIAADFTRFTGLHLAGLLAAAGGFLAWCLYGTSGAVRLVLWDKGTPPALSTRVPRVGAIPYFTLQLGLAGLVYYLGDLGRIPTQMWLVLLPPVACSVFLLERQGITVVCVLTLGIFILNVIRWHGWIAVPYSSVAFSVGMVFTLVFTLLTVNSEKARGEVQRLAGQLGEANNKLREYAVQAEELAMTRERNRLAREIHDSLGHCLTVLSVQVDAACALLDRNPQQARTALEKAHGLTQEGLREIRRSVAALRASPLDNKSLEAALREMADESRAGGLAVEMLTLGAARRLSPQAELTLYRAGQEGLTNVRKHAKAAAARLVLDFRSESRALLRVSDDGAGAAIGAEQSGGFGLLGVRERAQLLGGSVRVETAPGAGFKLEVEVPG